MKRISLPMMQCDDGCGECCGPVLCKDHEYRDVNQRARERGIEPKDQGLTCPWFQEGRCQVYEVRPFICRLFGHSEKLVCKHGHNTNILPSLEKRLVKEYGKPTRFLHEVIPGWLEGMAAKTGAERALSATEAT